LDHLDLQVLLAQQGALALKDHQEMTHLLLVHLGLLVLLVWEEEFLEAQEFKDLQDQTKDRQAIKDPMVILGQQDHK
jgi:hypothetical protein